MTLGAALFAGGLGAATWRSGLRQPAIPRFGFAAVVLVATPLVTRVGAGVALGGVAVLAVALILVESHQGEPAVSA